MRSDTVRSTFVARYAEVVDQPLSLAPATLPRSGPWRTMRVKASLNGHIVSGQSSKLGGKARRFEIVIPSQPLAHWNAMIRLCVSVH